MILADFTFGEDQLELQRAARRLLEDRCSITAVRQAEVTPEGFDPTLYETMAELGWIGMGVPENLGGEGGDFLDLYALCEEMGRFLVPSPLLEAVLVAEVLAESSNRQLRDQILPAIASGACLVSSLITDALGDPGGTGITALPLSGGPLSAWRLDGTCPLVPFAASADKLLCAARLSGQTLDGPATGPVALFLIDADAPGITTTSLRNLGGVPLFAVTLDGVEVAADTLVVDPDGANDLGAADLLKAALTKAAVLQTAYIVGMAHSVLEMTNQYAKDRHQFGSPIGSFQAVQYMVSDILIDLHTTDLLGRRAAYRISAGLDYAWEAEVAIVQGKTAAAHLHRQAHEVHAGVGFMLEHPLTLFSRRSKFMENNFGDAGYHYDRISEILCDE